MESINDRGTPIAEQQKDFEMDDTISRLEDEVKENKEKQESPFWSKIPIIDKFYSNKENPPLSSESSPDLSNKEEIGSVATDEKKEHVILFEQRAGQGNVEDDLGQLNAEDKDMDFTRSWKTESFGTFEKRVPVH